MANEKILKTLTIGGDIQYVPMTNEHIGEQLANTRQNVSISANTNTDLASVTLTEAGKYIFAFMTTFGAGNTTGATLRTNRLHVVGTGLDNIGHGSEIMMGTNNGCVIQGIQVVGFPESQLPVTASAQVSSSKACTVTRSVIVATRLAEFPDIVGG